MMKNPRQKRAAKPALCFRFTPMSPRSRCRGRAMTLDWCISQVGSWKVYVYLLRRSHEISTAVE